jgi:formate hydrogenlyase subunit 3/multisubunit Na+/H+ antiporter MnhD subunit
MESVYAYVVILVGACILIGFVPSGRKNLVAALAVIAQTALTSVPSIRALTGETCSLSLKGSVVTGEIPLIIDPLSAWFILLVNFTFLTAVVYGGSFMKVYAERKRNLNLHWIVFLFTHAGILAVLTVQNSLVFLLAWEIMTLGAFILVIFNAHKTKTLKAGVNYLIQSHVAIVLLTLAFIIISSKVGSFSFSEFRSFTRLAGPLSGLAVMLIFLAGFGIKAGFVPFHTWLPHAHPAAPSHVSAMMSGVLIKTGIYGILRFILLMEVNYLVLGYIILAISVITAIYGVMLAIVQHNLKRLLAYHSIENIGIIGIGTGIGCLGIANTDPLLTSLGFAGALLHTLNHSLFKSLLFYGAGNVSQRNGTMNIERLGGIIKTMPHTAILFLIAALAICGLPPFNGFVSEFIIYSGLFNQLSVNSVPEILFTVFSIAGLALVGGLAMLCFTKAFGSVFLGHSRTGKICPGESSFQKLIPMYAIVLLMLGIGLFPSFFMRTMEPALEQFAGIANTTVSVTPMVNTKIIQGIGFYSSLFILLSATILFLRHLSAKKGKDVYTQTWGCGYQAATRKMQYTASSFVRDYRKLAGPMLMFTKHVAEIEGTFPSKTQHETHAHDKTEEYLIDRPLRQIRYFLSRFSFLQNGKLQFYILYGMIFITLVIGIPLILWLFKWLSNILNTI